MGKRQLRALAVDLARAIEPAGFLLMDRDEVDLRFLYVKPAEVHGLYERILLDSDGIEYDVAAIDAWVGLTRGFNSVRGMGERELVHVPGESERGWSPILSPQEREHYVRSVAAAAPQITARLAREKGQQLLDATRIERELAGRVISRLPSGDLQTLARDLRAHSSADERAYAERMLTWPAVTCVPGAAAHYELAALALTLSTRRSDGCSPYCGVNPTDRLDVNRTLQLIVDHLRWGVAREGSEV